jgi:hypothetical protein
MQAALKCTGSCGNASGREHPQPTQSGIIREMGFTHPTNSKNTGVCAEKVLFPLISIDG